jgi:hypothetical protein
MYQGIYEELITALITQKLNELSKNSFYIYRTKIDKAEASTILAQHLARTIKYALDTLNGDKRLGERPE